MGINTTLVPNHKVLTPPVSFSDIKSVLGVSVNTLSELNKSAKISRWAKYKPVRYTSDDIVTGCIDSNKMWNSNAGWWRANNGKCGLTITGYTNLQTLVTNVISSGWEASWGYERPTGSTTAPYRTAHFNWYCHPNSGSNDSFFSTFFVGNIANTVFYDNDQSIVYACDGAKGYRNQFLNTTYMLDIADIMDREMSVPFKNTYFGVVIFKEGWTTSDTLYVYTAVDNWNVNVEHYGKDIRETVPIHKQIFIPVTNNYKAIPILSSVAYDGDTLESHVVRGSTSGVTFYTIPLPAVDIEVQVTAKHITIDPVLSATRNGTGVNVTIVLTATKSSDSPPWEWSGNMGMVRASVFRGGKTPPDEYEVGYVPADTAFSSSWPKTKTMSFQYTSTDSRDWVQITVDSFDLVEGKTESIYV